MKINGARILAQDRPLQQPHQDASNSRQEILERIECLHIKCGFLDTKHLFMLPINWLNHRGVPYFNVEIVQNFYNACHTPKSFFVEKDFDS